MSLGLRFARLLGILRLSGLDLLLDLLFLLHGRQLRRIRRHDLRRRQRQLRLLDDLRRRRIFGGGDFLSPKAGKAMLGAVLRGNRGGKPVGDVRQLGGAYVIAPDGTLRWAKPSTYAGDHATVEEILAAAR